MMGLDRGKRRLFLLLAAVTSAVLLVNLSLLWGNDAQSKINIPIPGKPKPPGVKPPKNPSGSHGNDAFEEHAAIDDQHPISALMKQADIAWAEYDEGRSTTFKETVTKYRRKYGRHPPPGFRDWYRFARDKGVHNVDDFDQIMDDLRPFWGIEPSTIRSFAAHMHENKGDGISGIHIRNKKVWKITNQDWRPETFASMVIPFVEFLPDMDIAMNTLDQPRLVVPWDDMQALLKKEQESRRILPETLPEFTRNTSGLYKENDPDAVKMNPEWFSAPGQQYMLLAKEGCPPESHAKDTGSTLASSEALYKDPRGGFITNFNRSSDLCVIGPEIENNHGFLFAPSTIIASKRLLPVFGECKVNVNNDILFPANMYYRDDERYTYDPTYDYDWDDKEDSMIWRGVTSGGTNTADNWMTMHRQRLALITNGTVVTDKELRIMTEDPSTPGQYQNYETFHASQFAVDYTDVGFTEPFACVPDCGFYDGVWTYKKGISLSEQFKNKFLIDVDGHSFSGRWHAFLQSKSLGIKATIFREWHDSRLFAWRHFVPLDNRYDDIYSILTYFIGLGKPPSTIDNPYIQRHDFEGRKLGRQGREWAEKVLRKEDLEIYAFRLLLEYARVADDNRDRIGYSGDGSELDKYDSDNPIGPAIGGHS